MELIEFKRCVEWLENERTPTHAHPQSRRLRLSVSVSATARNGLNVKNNRNDSVSSPRGNTDSPPALGDSPSPIPFLCTQDDSDVVWNYYSPTSEERSPSAYNINNTPTTRKRKKKFYYNDFSPVTRIPMKKKLHRPTANNAEFFRGLKKELTVLNQNVQGLIRNKQNIHSLPVKKTTTSTKDIESKNMDDSLFENSVEEDDENIFNSRTQCILPKDKPVEASTPKASKYSIHDDFEDSMNDILIMATQNVEENVRKVETIPTGLTENFSSKLNVNSPKITNDSMDHLLGNINDSEIELLASQTSEQLAVTTSSKTDSNKMLTNKMNTRNTVTNSITNTRSNTNVISKVDPTIWSDDAELLNNVSDISTLVNNSFLNESKSKFMRHNSMPESPTQNLKVTKSCYAGKTFSRHISMPVSGAKIVANAEEFSQVIRCTPEEIKRKREAAKEKLMSKKLDPLAKKSPLSFYGCNNVTNKLSTPVSNTAIGTRKQPLRTVSSSNEMNIPVGSSHGNQVSGNANKKLSLQEQIEKKRQEALMKLQKSRSMGSRK